jgi:hypothetical protein
MGKRRARTGAHGLRGAVRRGRRGALRQGGRRRRRALAARQLLAARPCAPARARG